MKNLNDRVLVEDLIKNGQFSLEDKDILKLLGIKIHQDMMNSIITEKAYIEFLAKQLGSFLANKYNINILVIQHERIIDAYTFIVRRK